MALTAAKKTIAKKTATRVKKPPRQVWLTISEGGGEPDSDVHLTQKAAKTAATRFTSDGYSSRAIGPYVLAERATER